jgi:hypothetical protein
MRARCLTLLALAAVMGCPQETVAPRQDPSAPILTASHQTLAFNAMAGFNDPVPFVVQVTNTGIGTLANIELRDAYGQGQQAGWLWWSMTVRTAPTTLTLSPKTGNLPAGTYHATITLSSADASNGPVILTVTFTVAPANTPMIALSSRDHQFNATMGGAAPAAATFQVTNSGAGSVIGLTSQIRYRPGSATGWLTASYDRTTAPATLTLRASKTGVAAGLHMAEVDVVSSSAANSAQRIGVAFWLKLDSGTVIGTSPPEMQFVVASSGSLPLQETMLVLNLGVGTITGLTSTVSHPTGQPTGWLDARLSNNSAPAYLWLRPSRTNLSPGIYNAIVHLASSSPTVFKTIPVTLTVLAPGAAGIALNRTSLALSASAGAAATSADVAVTNSGAGVLSNLEVHVIDPPGQPAGWLRASLSSTTTPATLTLRATPGTLPPGTFEALVWVTATTAGNSPQSLPVSFTVR